MTTTTKRPGALLAIARSTAEVDTQGFVLQAETALEDTTLSAIVMVCSPMPLTCGRSWRNQAFSNLAQNSQMLTDGDPLTATFLLGTLAARQLSTSPSHRLTGMTSASRLHVNVEPQPRLTR